MADDDQKHSEPAPEPRFLPSQAEGDAQPEERVEHLRTPGQAEGTAEDVEEALRDQETDASG